MKNKKMLFVLTMLCALLFASCSTDVDLCYEENHPHNSYVKYDYDWSGLDESGIPDSMYVIAYRVVNRRRSLAVVNGRASDGHFIFNGLSPDEKLSLFPLPTGAYKFITFNKDDTQLVIDEVLDYVADETNETMLTDISVDYKVYQKGHPALTMPTIDWQDYNPYAQYLQPNLPPVTYDTIASIEIPNASTVTCRFAPQSITQHIDIYFNIGKDISRSGFRVDSVLCDISGVPCRINIANGYLDISHTAKMMFMMIPDGKDKWSDWEGADSDDSEATLRLHGVINVPSLTRNLDEKSNTGAGILQVIIFTSTADSDGNRIRKKIQGKINLYNTLLEANLMTVTPDGIHAVRNGTHGVLDIKAEIMIDGRDVKVNNDNNGGLDIWEACGEDQTPPVIDI
ncbi:MAG: hypothetical protein ACI4TW_02240 [Prevotella sp.]